MLVDFGNEACSELLALEEDDPSIAFSPGPADVAERYVWKKDSEVHLQSCRVRSNKRRTKVASVKYSQKIVDCSTKQVRTFNVPIPYM